MQASWHQNRMEIRGIAVLQHSQMKAPSSLASCGAVVAAAACERPSKSKQQQGWAAVGVGHCRHGGARDCANEPENRRLGPCHGCWVRCGCCALWPKNGYLSWHSICSKRLRRAPGKRQACSMGCLLHSVVVDAGDTPGSVPGRPGAGVGYACASAIASDAMCAVDGA